MAREVKATAAGFLPRERIETPTNCGRGGRCSTSGRGEITTFNWNTENGAWNIAANWLDVTDGDIAAIGPPATPDTVVIGTAFGPAITGSVDRVRDQILRRGIQPNRDAGFPADVAADTADNPVPSLRGRQNRAWHWQLDHGWVLRPEHGGGRHGASGDLRQSG